MTVQHQNFAQTLPTGYTLRPTTWDDLAAVVDMLNAWSQDRYNQDRFTPELIRMEWETPNWSPETHSRVIVTPDGDLVGYAEVWDTADPPVNVWTWARVHPAYEGRGIGTVLRAWIHARAQEAIDRCPPEARVTYKAGVDSKDAAGLQLLESLGMQHTRYFWEMRIDMAEAPPAPQWPMGISVRTYNHAEDVDAALSAVIDAFRDHYGFVERTWEAELERWNHWIESDPERDDSVLFLAVDDANGEVAGVSLCRNKGWDNPDVAHVSTLGVRRAYRRKGLALALLQHSFGVFWERGRPSVTLGVDADSLTGATRLYEKAGMYVEQRFAQYEFELRPGVELATVALDD
ncbi:MAG: GNAT family N-acetyltransferase [Anaerolineales bacterium]